MDWEVEPVKGKIPRIALFVVVSGGLIATAVFGFSAHHAVAPAVRPGVVSPPAKSPYDTTRPSNHVSSPVTPVRGAATAWVSTVDIAYPKLLALLEKKRVADVHILQDTLTMDVYFTDLKTGTRYRTETLRTEVEVDNLLAKLRASGVWFYFLPPKKQSSSGFPFVLLLLVVPLVLFIIFLFIKAIKSGGPQGSSGSNPGSWMGFTKPPSLQKAKQSASARGASVQDPNRITFKDVAGIEEALEEVHEIKEFLTTPERFKVVGARVPKGVLLYGPPGCGKTLLAKALAGESGATFISVAGSEFIEMFVGVGASRIRTLFNQAKVNLPAIIFIDELDALGRKRGSGTTGGGGDESAQTLNQLLTEMGGFEDSKGLIVMAATNRVDVLDPALLRPGRFDRHIGVDLPDVQSRKAILRIHAQGKPIKESDLDIIAKRTPGFSGADLENVLNEAAIFAARREKTEITAKELDDAIERIIAGPERKTRRLSDEEKRIVAYHESGHALVGYVLPGAYPVHKVTIIPRGQALGVTISLPEEERFLSRESELKALLAKTFGGRAAEQLIFADPTNGAAGDIRQATALARQMVMRFGMSQKLGPVDYGDPENTPSFAKQHSERAAADIDREVRRLINEALGTASAILEEHRDALERMVKVLLEKETVATPEEVAQIFGPLPLWGDPKSPDVAAEVSLQSLAPREEEDKSLLEQAADQVGDVLQKGLDTALKPLKPLKRQKDDDREENE